MRCSLCPYYEQKTSYGTEVVKCKNTDCPYKAEVIAHSQIDEAEEVKAIPLEKLNDFRKKVAHMNSVAIIQRLNKLIESVEDDGALD